MTASYIALSMSEQSHYNSLLAASKTRASDYSFANLWGWAPHYELTWRFDNTLCWLRQNKPDPVYWAPVGDWQAVQNWSTFPEMASGSRFIRVPESLCALWQKHLGDKVVIEEDRAMWDYLYLASDLATLSGNRYHKKKNLLNQFLKNYEYDYRSLSVDCVETVMDMQTEWCKWRDCDSSDALLAENDAVARVLVRWNDIPGLCGGIIRIDGKPVAYTLAEPLNSDTLVIHFEKGDTEIRGVYQAINSLFCNDMGIKYKYLNREQDLGDEGLRKAKESYLPCDFVKKYTVTIL